MIESRSGGEVVEWIALRRIAGGTVARAGSMAVDGGRPMPCEVADAVPRLVVAGYATLAEPDQWGLARASLTARGRERFDRLNGAYGPQSSPAVCCSHDECGAPSLWAMAMFDKRAHALWGAELPSGRYVAACGVVLDGAAWFRLHPPRGRVCGTCEALAAIESGR